MEIKEISIILSGQFQASVFNPSFVFSNLFDIENGEELELGLNQSDLKVIYKCKGITLIPTDNIIEFRIEKDFKDDTLTFAAFNAAKLLSLFTFLPKFQIGINYKVGPSNMFSKKIDHLSITDLAVDQISYRKDYENCILNLILESNTTLFNFHYSDTSVFNPECIINHLKEVEELWKAL